jgi:diaminopimelate decarboxylase
MLHLHPRKPQYGKLMNGFHYQDGELFVEQISAQALAQQYGTPCYIYSREILTQAYQAFTSAFESHLHQICYAVKANSTLAVLNLFARLGAGFDIVSVGELERVIAAGGDPSRVIFAGIGKRADEIERALQVGIQCFNVESRSELERINLIAGRLGVKAPVALRVNPDIQAGAHPYISTGLKENKFGIDIDEASELYQYMATQLPHVQIVGLACHIGSQITELTPFLEALDRVLILVNRLQSHGITLQHIDLGGGLGVPYDDEQFPTPGQYISALLGSLAKSNHGTAKIILEPGRALTASAGILVTRVEYLKNTAHKHFAIVDAAMNDLMRPALYDAWHDIVPVSVNPKITSQVYDVVGAVCETGDFLGKARSLSIQENDLLAVRTVGAYGFTMSSNYNSRGRPPEIMVDGERAYLIRERETVSSLFSTETVLP